MLPHFQKRRAGSRKEHDAFVRSVCRECAVGCGLLAYVKDNRIVDVQGDESHPVSRGRLCARGIAFHRAIVHPDRIVSPLWRASFEGPFTMRDGWEKALDDTARQLEKIRERHGPESLLVGCDPSSGLDFHMGALRFARLWGTPRVYHPLEGAGGESRGPWPMVAPVPRCTDWIHDRGLLLVESDLAATHPVAFGRVMEARQKGAKIVAADSRFTATLAKADKTCMIRPRSGNALGLFLLKGLLEENSVEESVVSSFADFGAWKASFENLSWESAERITGLSPESILELSRLLADRGPVAVITGEEAVCRPRLAVWSTLSRAMGWSDLRGGGWYPLEPGGPPLHPETGAGDAPPRPELPSGPPLFCRSRQDPFPKGDVKAAIVSGDWPAYFPAFPSPPWEEMDLVATFASFPGETVQRSRAVFPASLPAEQDVLSFTNDGAAQWGPRMVTPPGQCRSGLDFWAGLAERLGWGEFFPWKTLQGLADHKAFYGWLLKQGKETAGCALEDLEKGEPFFPPSPKPEDEIFHPVHASPELEKDFPPALPEDDLLVFQAPPAVCSASRRRPWLEEGEERDRVHLHPETARSLGIENGDRIVVEGSENRMEGRARLSRTVPRRMLWASTPLGEERVTVRKAS